MGAEHLARGGEVAAVGQSRAVRSRRTSGNTAQRRAAWVASAPGPRAAPRRPGPRSGRRRADGGEAPRSRPDQAASKASTSSSIAACGSSTGGVIGRPSWASRPRRAGGAGCARRRARAGPASTAGADRARHRDRVLRAGDRARARARASHPSSMASAASEAVPTPGVEDHRHARVRSTDEREVVRVADAHAAADRRAERHRGGAARVLEAPGQDRVVIRVRQHDELLVDELLGGGQQPAGSGSSVRSSPITSSLTQSVPNASPASARSAIASRAVKQPAVFGSSGTARSPSRRRSSRAPRGRPGAAPPSRPRSRLSRRPAIGSRRVKPPVPGIRRERSSRPASSSASRWSGSDRRSGLSASLDGPAATSTRGPSATLSCSHSPRGTTAASIATATPRAPRSTPSSSSSAATGAGRARGGSR